MKNHVYSAVLIGERYSLIVVVDIAHKSAKQRMS